MHGGQIGGILVDLVRIVGLVAVGLLVVVDFQKVRLVFLVKELIHVFLDEGQVEEIPDVGTAVGVLLEQDLSEFGEVGVHGVGERGGFFVDNLFEEASQLLVVERTLESDKFVEDAADCPDIGFLAVRISFAHL